VADGKDNPRVSTFLRELHEAERHQERYALKWRHYEKVYLGHPADNPKQVRDVKRQGGERYYPPYVLEQVETIKPRLVDPEPDFEWIPVEPSDNNDALKRVRYLHRKQFADDRLVDKQEEWAHDGLTKGLFVAKVVWEYETRKLKFNRKLNQLQKFAGVPAQVEKDVVVNNRPKSIRVDPYDFFWDPAATCDANWRYVFHRSWLSKADLQKRVDAGLYDATAVKAMLKARESGEESSSRFEGETKEASSAKRGDRYEVIERWKLESGGVTLLVVGGRKHVLRDIPSPFWHGRIPFVADCLQRVPDDLVGIAEVSLLEDSQKLAWDMDNDQRDAVKKGLNPPFKYRRNMKGGKDFRIIPDGRIGVDRMDDIEQVQINSNGVWGREDLQFILGRMQSITGATPYAVGADGSGSGFDQNTATGVSILAQEANKRMMLKQLHVQQFLARIASMFLQLNQQFLTEDQEVRITGGRIVSVPLEEVAQLYDVRPKWSNLSVNKEGDKQKQIELVNTLLPISGVPMPDGTMVNVKPAVTRLIEAYDMDPEVFFAAPSPPGYEGAAPPGIQEGDIVEEQFAEAQ
jgi:hypothetical protein